MIEDLEFCLFFLFFYIRIETMVKKSFFKKERIFAPILGVQHWFSPLSSSYHLLRRTQEKKTRTSKDPSVRFYSTHSPQSGSVPSPVSRLFPSPPIISCQSYICASIIISIHVSVVVFVIIYWKSA